MVCHHWSSYSLCQGKWHTRLLWITDHFQCVQTHWYGVCDDLHIVRTHCHWQAWHGRHARIHLIKAWQPWTWRLSSRKCALVSSKWLLSSHKWLLSSHKWSLSSHIWSLCSRKYALVWCMWSFWLYREDQHNRHNRFNAFHLVYTRWHDTCIEQLPSWRNKMSWKDKSTEMKCTDIQVLLSLRWHSPRHEEDALTWIQSDRLVLSWCTLSDSTTVFEIPVIFFMHSRRKIKIPDAISVLTSTCLASW